MKLLIQLCLLEFGFLCCSAQFFGSRFIQTSCDLESLGDALKKKDICFRELAQLKIQAIKAIQEIDRSCNRGVAQLLERCQEAYSLFADRNDLDGAGVVACCLPRRKSIRVADVLSRLDLGVDRKCPFKNTITKSEFSFDGPLELEESWRLGLTVSRFLFQEIDKLNEHFDDLIWCRGIDKRVLSEDAIRDAFRVFSDRFRAKLIDCYQPALTAAQNCSQLDGSQGLTCLQQASFWSRVFQHHCYELCQPGVLPAICHLFLEAEHRSPSEFDPFSN